jgi:hypothetical protein
MHTRSFGHFLGRVIGTYCTLRQQLPKTSILSQTLLRRYKTYTYEMVHADQRGMSSSRPAQSLRCFRHQRILSTLTHLGRVGGRSLASVKSRPRPLNLFLMISDSRAQSNW